MSTLDKILLGCAIFLVIFIITMVILFCIFQAIPDTLVECVLQTFSCEAVVTFLIWWLKKKKQAYCLLLIFFCLTISLQIISVSRLSNILLFSIFLSSSSDMKLSKKSFFARPMQAACISIAFSIVITITYHQRRRSLQYHLQQYQSPNTPGINLRIQP